MNVKHLEFNKSVITKLCFSKKLIYEQALLWSLFFLSLSLSHFDNQSFTWQPTIFGKHYYIYTLAHRRLVLQRCEIHF